MISYGFKNIQGPRKTRVWDLALRPLPPPPAEIPPEAPPAASNATVAPSAGARMKHKRESQDDVAHFSSWSDLGDALAYAKAELAPREAQEGTKWRVIKRADDREDKSRDKQWRCHRSLAIAVGILVRGGQSYADAVAAVHTRFIGEFNSKHTPFLKKINEEIGKMRACDAEAIAREVLGF